MRKNIKCLFIALIVLSLTLLSISCAGSRDLKTAPILSQDGGIMESTGQYSYLKLPNGLRIFVVEDHRVPLLTFSITYNVGSVDEPKGKSGISHFLEHVMFLGTHALGKEEVFTLIREAGGSNNAATSFDFTTYWAEVPANKLELIVAIEADRMGNLVICPDEFEREKQVVMQERRQTVENRLYSSIMEDIRAHAFPDSSLNHGVIGWMEDIESITVEDMQRYYTQFYSPNNAVIVVSGDADSEKVFSLIEKYFGHYEPQEIVRAVRIDPPQQEERFIRIEKSTNIPFISILYRTPEGNHPDVPAINAFLDILINDPNSRVTRKLTKEMRIILGGGGSLMPLRIPGYAFISLATFNEDMLDTVKNTFDNEILDIIKNGIEVDELDIVKKKILKREIFSQRRMGMLARQIGMNTVRYEDPDFSNTQLKRYQELTEQDILRVANEYFASSNRTIAYILPKRESSEVDDNE